MSRRTILFGAFDRHNLGDLLFPHIVAALLRARGRAAEPLWAGLAARDLRAFGGHRTEPLAALLNAHPHADVIHVGGEILTCDAWRAAVMLLPAERFEATVRHLEARPVERARWVRTQLGADTLAPYVLPAAARPRAGRVIYNAVGGATLADAEPALRAEVLAALTTADAVAVRDQATRAVLAAAGVAADLLPDPATLTAALFGPTVAAHATQGPVAAARAEHPDGYLAVQFSTDFADDRTLDTLARALDDVATGTGLGLVLFRAGAAPWHDDAALFVRLRARVRSVRTHLFSALHLWDLCALIAHSRGFCGSSLHGRIVATAFARPRVNLRSPAAQAGLSKQSAYADTWELPHLPGEIPVEHLADAMHAALAADPQQLAEHGAHLADTYRRGAQRWLEALQ